MDDKKENMIQKLQTILGIILSAVAIPVIILNISLIFKTITNSGVVPDFAGYFPLVTLTDSMAPEIYGGDLIIYQKLENGTAEIGDVIAFSDPDSKKRAITTHRIVEKHWLDDGIYYRTKGDANSVADHTMVKSDNVFGLYLTKISKLGHVVLFVQSPVGVVLLVVFPLCAFVLYDAGRKYLEVAKLKKENEELKDRIFELEAELIASKSGIYSEPRIADNKYKIKNGGDY